MKRLLHVLVQPVWVDVPQEGPCGEKFAPAFFTVEGSLWESWDWKAAFASVVLDPEPLRGITPLKIETV